MYDTYVLETVYATRSCGGGLHLNLSTYLAEVLIYAWNGKFDNYHFSSVPGFSKHEKEIEDALDRMYSRKYAPITE